MERLSLCRPTRPYVEGIALILQGIDLVGKEKFIIIKLYIKFKLKAIFVINIYIFISRKKHIAFCPKAG